MDTIGNCQRLAFTVGVSQVLNLRSQNQNRGKILLFENYGTSEGAFSNNVLYLQTLPITRNQERFYDDSYFE